MKLDLISLSDLASEMDPPRDPRRLLPVLQDMNQKLHGMVLFRGASPRDASRRRRGQHGGKWWVNRAILAFLDSPMQRENERRFSELEGWKTSAERRLSALEVRALR